MNSPLKLTPRQHHIVQLLAEGHTATTAGKELFLCSVVIRQHLRAARQRTEAKTTNQLMAWYGQRGAVVEDLRGANKSGEAP